MVRFAPLVWLVACTTDPGARLDGVDTTIPTGATPTSPSTDTESEPNTSPTTAATTSTPGDEAAVRDLIAGNAALAEVLAQVAWGGGFPVATAAGTYLFVAEGSGWSLAGDFDGWSPEPMTEADGFDWIEVAIADPAGQGYKFTRGADWVADPWARSYTYDGNGELSYVEPPGDRSRLDRWPDVAGEGLTGRDVRVYVPPGQGPFPVLYAHDGQNLYDPAAIWGGWHLAETADAASSPLLIVGIDNTPDRMDEYTHTTDIIYGYSTGGKGDAYAKLIQNEIRPVMERVYGTTGLDGVMGSSLGGLISLHIAQAYPDEFDFAGSLSGTLGWGKFEESNPVMEELYLADGPMPFTVYADSGGSDGGGGCTDRDGDGFPEDDPNDADNYCVTRQFTDSLGANGWTWNQDLFHWWEPDAEHNEYFWSLRAPQVIEQFLASAP